MMGALVVEGLNGALNNHNVRIYAPAHQAPDFHYNVNDSRQKLISWVVLCRNDDMLGPFPFDGHVNGQSYLKLLNDKVIPLITVLFQTQINENLFQRLWWVQDGSPCHRLLAVRARLTNVLDKTF